MYIVTSSASGAEPKVVHPPRRAARGVLRLQYTAPSLGSVEVRWLLWDDHNIEHIATHDVRPAEAEQVVFGLRTNGPFNDDRHRRGRLVFFGYTLNGRPLVVVTDRPTTTGEAYVVSARSANERERKKYLEEL